jgi:hypothetical protein
MSLSDRERAEGFRGGSGMVAVSAIASVPRAFVVVLEAVCAVSAIAIVPRAFAESAAGSCIGSAVKMSVRSATGAVTTERTDPLATQLRHPQD